jgi:hypothetical protein
LDPGYQDFLRILVEKIFSFLSFNMINKAEDFPDACKATKHGDLQANSLFNH